MIDTKILSKAHLVKLKEVFPRLISSEQTVYLTDSLEKVAD